MSKQEKANDEKGEARYLFHRLAFYLEDWKHFCGNQTKKLFCSKKMENTKNVLFHAQIKQFFSHFFLSFLF